MLMFDNESLSMVKNQQILIARTMSMTTSDYEVYTVTL
jgi:hypothetical protein